MKIDFASAGRNVFPGGGDRFILLLFSYLPLCMPGHLFVNHLLGRPWTWFAPFLYPEGVLSLCLFVETIASQDARARLWARLKGRRLRLTFLCASVFVAWTAVCAVRQAAPSDFWIERLLVGWVFPMLVAAVLLGRPGLAGVDAAWKGATYGLVALLPIEIGLYVASFGIPRSFAELAFENRSLKMGGGFKSGIYFGELTLGGINDIAVFFLVAIAAASGLFALRHRLSRGAYAVLLVWMVLALILEFLCYSRGAIIGLILVGLVSVAFGLRRSALRGLFVPAAMILAFALCSVSSPLARKYWLDQVRVREGSTAWIRWKLWSSWKKADLDPRVLIKRPPARDVMSPSSSTASAGGAREWFGFGLGNYGVLQGMTLEFPTHNIFLDALVTSGIPGMLLFTGFWGTFLVAAITSARRELRRPPEEWANPPGLGIASAGIVLTIAGATVTFLFWNLGTMLNGTLAWFLVVLAMRGDMSKGMERGIGRSRRLEGTGWPKGEATRGVEA